MKNEKERVTMSNIIDEVIKRCNMVAGTMKANKIFDFAVTGSAALAIEGFQECKQRLVGVLLQK